MVQVLVVCRQRGGGQPCRGANGACCCQQPHAARHTSAAFCVGPHLPPGSGPRSAVSGDAAVWWRRAAATSASCGPADSAVPTRATSSHQAYTSTVSSPGNVVAGLAAAFHTAWQVACAGVGVPLLNPGTATL